MVDKVNGKAFAGEFLGKNLDFYTITTPTDLTGAANQAKFDKVVETISLNGQPIILSAPTYAANTTTLKFAIEHTGAWEANTAGAQGVGFDGNARADALKASLDKVPGLSPVTVTKADTI